MATDMVRPTKFTAETVKVVLAGIRAGLPYRLSAEAAGIHYDTFNEWVQGRFPRGADKDLKAAFPDRLTRARGESAARLTALISTAASTDWRAAAWLLERRFPKDFARDASLYERLDALEASLQDAQQPPIRRIG
jgi:hypothetical protein